MKRALVLGPGGLKGSFTAGVTSQLVQALGDDYFDTIYASSVGVYSAAFFVANQPEIMELLWREFVSDDQLVNFSNPLRGRNILDLEYLNECFKKLGLDTDKATSSSTKLVFCVTKYQTMMPEYITATKDNLLSVMTASCALPFVHETVRIDGTAYLDGGLTDQIPIEKAISDGHDEILVVANKRRGVYLGDSLKHIIQAVSYLPENRWKPILQQYRQRARQQERIIHEHTNTRSIQPAQPLPLRTILDTDYKRINQTFDMGVQAAKDFLNNYP